MPPLHSQSRARCAGATRRPARTRPCYCGDLLNWLRRASNLPAVIAALVAVILGVVADAQNRQLAEAHARGEVMAQVNLIQDRLEGDIRGEIQLVRGLAADIAAEPNLDQDRFDALCAYALRSDKLLREIGVAPGLVVTLVCPLSGNEAALGLDLRKNESQREAALRARDSGVTVLAGPVEFGSGRNGFIARLPVFVAGADETRRFWGVVSAVIDIDELYRDAGLSSPDLSIDVAIVGRDAQGRDGFRFFGDARTIADDPVTATVRVPSGAWTLSAVPKGGWEAAPADSGWRGWRFCWRER